MNQIKQIRTARGLSQKQLARQLKEAEPRIDGAMVCRYEAGICLPTRTQLESLETALQTPRTGFYDMDDLRLLPDEKTVAQVRRADERSTKYLRKCYRMSRAFAATLPNDLYEVCGYTSEQSWYDAVVKRLLGEYAAKCKGRRGA